MSYVLVIVLLIIVAIAAIVYAIDKYLLKRGKSK